MLVKALEADIRKMMSIVENGLTKKWIKKIIESFKQMPNIQRKTYLSSIFEEVVFRLIYTRNKNPNTLFRLLFLI